MNIDGVKVLAQEAISESPDWLLIVVALLLGCMTLTAILAIVTNETWPIVAFGTSVIVLFLWMIIAGVCGIFNKPSDRNIYKCIFDKNVSIIEVYDKYEIVGRDGEIWILEDKE